MSHQTELLEHASIRQYCKIVRTPAVAANFMPLAEQAIKEQHSHVRYLEALLAMECEERDRHAIVNRIRESFAISFVPVPLFGMSSEVWGFNENADS
jgi:hypothetical protein